MGRLAKTKKTSSTKLNSTLYHFSHLTNKNNGLALTDVDEKKRSNREKYPEIAAFVDKVREYFPDAKVTAIRNLSPEEMEKRKARQAQANREQGVRVSKVS